MFIYIYNYVSQYVYYISLTNDTSLLYTQPLCETNVITIYYVYTCMCIYSPGCIQHPREVLGKELVHLGTQWYWWRTISIHVWEILILW